MTFFQKHTLLFTFFAALLLCVTSSCEEEAGKKKKFEPKFDDEPTVYEVRLKTGCDSLAGTAANIYLIMKGENGDSGELLVERPGIDKITPCETSILDFKLDRNLGQIKTLEVWHDNSNENPSWLPEIITVVNKKNLVRWDFPCGKWLDKEQFDKRIRRTFYTNRECN